MFLDIQKSKGNKRKNRQIGFQQTIKLLPSCSKKREARKETDRLCSDNETRGGDGKAER
jgi:hypothetical protein